MWSFWLACHALDTDPADTDAVPEGCRAAPTGDAVALEFEAQGLQTLDVDGEFTSWTGTSGSFLADDGTTYGASPVGGDPPAGWPDFAGLGRVHVLSEEPASKGMNRTRTTIFGSDGSLAFFGGLSVGTAGDMSVDVDEMDVCPARSGGSSCWDTVANVRLRLTRGDASAAAFESDEAEIDGLVLHVATAWQTADSHCDDVGNGLFVQFWVAPR